MKALVVSLVYLIRGQNRKEYITINEKTKERAFKSELKCVSSSMHEIMAVMKECEAEFEWVRLENKGKEIKITVQPNTTGKICYFRCN